VVVSLKYAILIMRADNHGEGGIVALLALLDARNAPARSWRASLLIVGLVGAALLYGDGIITPAISVLSAVEGLKIDAPRLGPLVVPLTLAILIGLFLIQKPGTAFVGTIFGPVMLIWFVGIAVLGLAAIVRANPLRKLATDPAKYLVVFCAEKATVKLDAAAFARMRAGVVPTDAWPLGRFASNAPSECRDATASSSSSAGSWNLESRRRGSGTAAKKAAGGPTVPAAIDAFDKVIATNLRGSFLVMSEAANRVADGGRIVTFSSSVLGRNLPAYGAYIASKAGVEGLTRVLANELGQRKITVNAVAPGPVATELFLKGKSEEQIAGIGKLAPLGRIGEVTDIVGMVSFLVGPEGGWVNGQVLRVNGGFA